MTYPLGGQNFHRAAPSEVMQRMASLLGGSPYAQRRALYEEPEDENPSVAGRGPLTVSTCTDVEGPLPLHIWDVNGYYRDLGVHPRATRKELMRAYQRHGIKPSARVTYVFKQLLNPDVRRAYDMMPLGEIYVDQYVHDYIHRQVKLELSRRMWEQAKRRERDIFAPDGDDPNYEDILNEFGFHVVDEEEPGESLDTANDPDKTPKEPAQSRAGVVFPYSYFLWRSKDTDVMRLAMWQETIVQALIERKVRTRIAVGYCGRMAHPYVVGVIGDQIVVFLNDIEEPNLGLARRAADRVVDALAQRQPASRREDRSNNGRHLR